MSLELERKMDVDQKQNLIKNRQRCALEILLLIFKIEFKLI